MKVQVLMTSGKKSKCRYYFLSLLYYTCIPVFYGEDANLGFYARNGGEKDPTSMGRMTISGSICIELGNSDICIYWILQRSLVNRKKGIYIWDCTKPINHVKVIGHVIKLLSQQILYIFTGTIIFHFSGLNVFQAIRG